MAHLTVDRPKPTTPRDSYRGGRYRPARMSDMDFAELVRLGAEPTPTQVSPYLVEHLETRGPSRRSDLVTAIEAAWHSASGRQLQGTTPKVKKALSALEEQGIVRQSGAYGIWMLADDEKGDLAAAAYPDHVPTEPPDPDSDEPAMSSDREVGEGRQLVYCYYLETYRSAAEANSRDRWPSRSA